MNSKGRRTYRIILSILALILSALSSSIAYGFLGATGWSFATRFFIGLILLESPVAAFLLVMELFRKEK